MPYASVDELPSAVRAKLKGKKLRQWMHVWNSSHARHGDESRAFAEAWSTVQKMENAMTDFQFFLPIAKVDEKKRTVSGYASTPTKDSDGEIVTLEAVRAALPEYMTYGNIREMHALKAVGVAKEANIDTKGLFLTAKIVDDNAWKKCLEGVYKGFSIGGRKLDKEGDKITAIDLTEISVVDRPANPDCRISLAKRKAELDQEEGGYLVKVKAKRTPEQKALAKMAGAVEALAKNNPPAARDGFSLPAAPTKEPTGTDSPNDSRPEENVTRKTETEPEKPVTSEIDKGGDAPGDGSKPYGDVQYADPGYQADKKKRYPIDVEKHIRAAWNYINKPKNAAKYSLSQLKSMKSKIVSAWRSKVDSAGPPSLSAKKAKKLAKVLLKKAIAEGIESEDDFLVLRKGGAPKAPVTKASDDADDPYVLSPNIGEESNMDKEPEIVSTGDPLADALNIMLKRASDGTPAQRLGMAKDNVRKARKAMKECRKAIEDAHKMHKAAYLSKAKKGDKPKDGDDEDDGFDHAGAMEKLQKAYGALDKARVFGKAAIGDIAKAESIPGRSGQKGEEVGDSEGGFYQVPSGVKDMSPGEMSGAKPGTSGTGSQPPLYPVGGDVYPGKADVGGDLRKYTKKDGTVSAEVAELFASKAKMEGELEALRRVPAAAAGGRRPYNFDVTKVMGETAAPRDLQRTLFDGVDTSAFGSGDERAHTEASARVIGNFIQSGHFGKSVFDPTFQGAAGAGVPKK